MRLARNAGGPADGLYTWFEGEVLMPSRPRVPEQLLATDHLKPVVLASSDDPELSAVALLCLVFARRVQHPHGRPLHIEETPGSEVTAALGALCPDKGSAST
jgi:hypothetical protein